MKTPSPADRGTSTRESVELGQRARNKLGLMQRIRDAARIEFLAHGIHDADVSEIAERANIGRATLYRYFENKGALVTALINEDWDKQARLFQRLAEEPVLNSDVVAAWLHALIRATRARLQSFPIYHNTDGETRARQLDRQRERLIKVLGVRFPELSGDTPKERISAMLLLFQIEMFVAYAAASDDAAETQYGVDLIAEQLLARLPSENRELASTAGPVKAVRAKRKTTGG